MSKSYSIQEVSRITGLPQSTLRYYEKIGIIPAVTRQRDRRIRSYDDVAVQYIESLAALRASGMPLKELREYVRYRDHAAASAAEQVALFRLREQRLLDQSRRLATQLEYVRLKIAYWQAADAGDAAQVTSLHQEAKGLARALRSDHDWRQY